MNIFTIIVLGIMLKGFIEQKNSKQRFITILAVDFFVSCHIVNQGSFINISGFSVTHLTALKIITLIYALIYCIDKKLKIKKTLLFKWLSLICVIFIGIILQLLWNYRIPIVCALSGTWDEYFLGLAQKTIPVYSTYNTSVLTYTLIFLVILLIVYSTFKQEDYNALMNKLVFPSKLLISIGFIEAILKNILHSSLYNSFLIVFFGNSSTATLNELVERNGLYRLQGLSAESSTYSFSLFICCLLFLKYREKIWMYLSLILLLLSTAFSGIAFLFLFILIFLLSKNHKNKKTSQKIIILSCIVLVISCFLGLVLSSENVFSNISFFKENEYGQRIIDAVERIQMILKGNYIEGRMSRNVQGSTFTRMVSSATTLGYVIHRPLFGFGLGTFSNFGYTSNLISSIGIIGFLFWNRFVFFGNLKSQKTNIEYLVIVITWYVINLFLGGSVVEFYREANLLLVLFFQQLLLDEKFYEQQNKKTKLKQI